MLDAKGITQATLAQHSGVSKQLMTDVVKGRRRPPLKAVPIWADAMGLGPNERLRLFDLAIAAHLPKEAQARFVELLQGYWGNKPGSPPFGSGSAPSGPETDYPR